MTHDHRPDAGSQHVRTLALVFALVLGFAAVEVVAGLLTGSLTLLSDAGHMVTDSLGIGMALAAIIAANQARVAGRRTYGSYRLEILAAGANALLVIGVAAYVLVEAARRVSDPPSVETGPMLAVAVAGLAVNLIAWALLRERAGQSLNLEGAMVEVIADLVGSLAAVGAAIGIRLTGFQVLDPIVAIGVLVFVFPRAIRLARRAWAILVQAAPEHVDLEVLLGDLAALPGVVGVHDLHVWTLASDMEVATVHLVTRDGADPHPVLDRAREVVEQRHGIRHATLQVDPETHEGCAEIGW